jgi:hypothetical protein
LLKRCE